MILNLDWSHAREPICASPTNEPCFQLCPLQGLEAVITTPTALPPHREEQGIERLGAELTFCKHHSPR